MTEKDKKRFVEIMYGLADNYSAEISKPGLKFRFDVLKKYPIEEIEKAAHKIVETWQYTKMPPIAEFVNKIEGDKPQIEDIAEYQAHEVITQIKQAGYNKKPVFTDPITTKLIKRRFNFRSLCQTLLESENKWFVKEFKEAYCAYSRINNQQQIEVPPEINLLIGGIGDENREQRHVCDNRN